MTHDPLVDLAALRRPNVADPHVLDLLRSTALTHRDQRTQIAAIAGLGVVGGSDAVLICAERLRNVWGMGALKRTISTLTDVAADGGLLVLTATLLRDYRLYPLKLAALAKGAKRLELSDVATQLSDLVSEVDGLQTDSNVEATLAALLSVPIADIASGAVLASLISVPGIYSVVLEWDADALPPIAADDVLAQATAYAEQRVPGFVSQLRLPNYF